MFKHSVVYVDYNGVPHNEDLYFHMMVPEFVDLEYNPSFDTSLSDYIKQEMGSGENRKVYTVFKLLVVNSYGRRSADGANFSKKAEWTEEFLNSQAWEQFFLWLTEGTEGKNGQIFFNEIFPQSMRDQIAEKEKAQAEATGNSVAVQQAAPKKTMSQMSREELEAAFLAKQASLGVKTIETEV